VALQNNPLFQEVVQQQEQSTLPTLKPTLALLVSTALSALVRKVVSCSWLMVPVLYQGRLLHGGVAPLAALPVAGG